MLYAVGVFSYFIASIASVLVGLDARQGDLEATGQKGVRLDEQEVEVLRRILKRADEARR
jgi:hypothetical protein